MEVGSMVPLQQQSVKTSISLDKNLLEEIDRYNPFPTRKEFLDRACRDYLEEVKRKQLYDALAAACAESADEDMTGNKEWDHVTLETWR